MSQLILVRHSVPEIVPGLPARSWSLAPEGRERGQALAEKLRVAGHQPSVVVSSTEPKAEQTASIIASAYGMPYEVVEGLHEHERDGVPFMERALFEKVVADFFERPTELVFGNETAAQALQRFSSAVSTVVRRHQAGDIVVVTHGTVMTLFVAFHGQAEAFTFWRSLSMPEAIVLTLPDYRLARRYS